MNFRRGSFERLIVIEMFIKKLVVPIKYIFVLCFVYNVHAMKKADNIVPAQEHGDKEKESSEHVVKINSYTVLCPYLEGKKWPFSKVVIDYRIKQEDLKLFLNANTNIKDLEITDCTKVYGFIKNSKLCLDCLTIGIKIRSGEELSTFIKITRDFPICYIEVSYDSYDTAFSDEDIEMLVENCPYLVSLTINTFQRVTIEGLVSLATLDKLISLNLIGCRNLVKYDLKSTLSSFPVLQRVVFPNKTELSGELLKSYLSE